MTVFGITMEIKYIQTSTNMPGICLVIHEIGIEMRENRISFAYCKISGCIVALVF